MRAIIRVNNVQSQLSTDTPKVSQTLWRCLRFRAKDYFHSRLYKQGKWDGFDEFFKRDSGKFLTGLLPEVETALKHLGCEYVIQDGRGKPVQLVNETIGPDFLEPWNKSGKKFTLQDYQWDLSNQLFRFRRGIIQAPTSAGKTAVMMAIIKNLREGTPTLLLTNQSSLSHQNYEELMKWGFQNVGQLYDKYTKPNVITCANWQSLHKIERLLPHIKALVVDEIHDMISKGPRKFYVKMTAANLRVAVSATPFKFGGKDKTQKYLVKGHFGPVLKTKSDAAENGVLTTRKLQERGTLSRARCTFYPVHEPDMQFLVYGDAVTRISSDLDFARLVHRRAVTLKGRTLILVERLAHGDMLHGMIPGSMWVQGKDNLDTRKEVITQLQSSSGNVVAIATRRIFNTGLNFFVHNIINACGGTAEHATLQLFGRGLRTAPDKEILDYYDFLFTSNEYLESHSNNRMKTLSKEGHPVEVKDFDF
jgi:superfamily II DNA or RNA helicase